jgi:hypothetical protein
VFDLQGFGLLFCGVGRVVILERNSVIFYHITDFQTRTYQSLFVIVDLDRSIAGKTVHLSAHQMRTIK